MRKDIINLTIKLGCIFLVLTSVFAVTYYENAELAMELLEPYFASTEDLMADDGSISFKGLWLNNLFVCAQTVAMGIIPMIFLPMFTMLSNATLFGSILGLTAAESEIKLMDAIFYAVLPHGVFELPAMFLTFALGFYLCGWMTKRLFRRNLEDPRTTLDLLNDASKIFVLVIIPLITVAAVVECFVTPEIVVWAGLA